MYRANVKFSTKKIFQKFRYFFKIKKFSYNFFSRKISIFLSGGIQSESVPGGRTDRPVEGRCIGPTRARRPTDGLGAAGTGLDLANLAKRRDYEVGPSESVPGGRTDRPVEGRCIGPT